LLRCCPASQDSKAKNCEKDTAALSRTPLTYIVAARLVLAVQLSQIEMNYCLLECCSKRTLLLNLPLKMN
jgi:hypothetical protein